MEDSVKLVDGHFQVALPWRQDPPDIPNNKIMAEKRLRSLRNRLMKDTELFKRYTQAMQDYIAKGHAEKVPKKELNKDNGRIWYLPHHPVTHRLKPDKTRIVFDCAAKFKGESLKGHWQPKIYSLYLLNIPIENLISHFRVSSIFSC